MIKKFFMAFLLTVASFNLVMTSEAANFDSEKYCCRSYESDYCQYNHHENKNYRHGEHHNDDYCY